jgi:hypothetical protein
MCGDGRTDRAAEGTDKGYVGNQIQNGDILEAGNQTVDAVSGKRLRLRRAAGSADAGPSAT